MALINIRDLPQSVELDRVAMQATIGGARAGSSVSSVPKPADAARQRSRVVDYPPGFGRDIAPQARGKPSAT